MPSRAQPGTTEDSGHSLEDEHARAWSQLTVKVNTGNYGNAEFSLGASMACENTPEAIRATQRRIIRQHRVTVKAEIRSLLAEFGDE